MTLDDRARQFLASGDGPIQTIPGQTSERAAERLAAAQRESRIKNGGKLAEDLIAFFVQQRKVHDYTDDESAAAVALFAINLRHAYGQPQNEKEDSEWSDETTESRLFEFDAICIDMQNYFDENV